MPKVRTSRARRLVIAVAAALAAGAGALAPATAATAHQMPSRATTASAPARQQARSAAAAVPKVTQHPSRRTCSQPARGHASCLAMMRTDVTGHKGLFRRGVTAQAAPSGYGPTDLQSAYDLPSATAGGGATVAVVDAYDDPNAEADLATYRAQYGLPECTTANGCFKKVDQEGQQGSYPTPNSGWATEESLDVDMVSAVCPNCKILLVEANDNYSDNLGAAVDEAVTLGAKYVTNSYGGAEDPSELQDDQHFNHPGTVITASSGDSGYGTNYPSASQYVTAVGGTSLVRNSTVSRGWTESVWGKAAGGQGAGSGCSAYEAQPSWQAGVISGCATRATADISADADPSTGVAVYDSYQTSGWQVYGGTSVASPIIASTYALAGLPASGTYPASYLYTHHTADPSVFNDVTSGANGPCTPSVLCTAGAGWDGPTGLGTPAGVAGFAYTQVGSVTGTVTDPGTGAPIAGAHVAIPGLSATTNGDGGYTLSGLPPGSYQVTASAYGYQPQTQTVTVTANQATTQNFQLVAGARETVSGKVAVDAGTAWPLYAQVSWDDGDGHKGTTYSDPATGAYSLNLLDNSDYTLTVTLKYPGYEPPAAKKISVGTSAVGQDFAAEADPLACTAIGYQATNIGTTQGFDQSSLPKGWTVTNVDRGYPGYSSKPGWTFDNPGKRANDTGGTGNFAIVDSDYYGPAHYQDTYLTSPAIDMSADKNPVVQFASDLVTANNSTATVEYSTDGGKTWDKVWTNTGLPGDPGPATKLLGLSKAAGQSDVRVRFGYQGSWSQYWEIDNVFLGERTCTQKQGGLLVGRVADSGGTAINGATVSSVADPSEKAVTVATPGDTVVGGGLYTLFVSETGDRQFTASATGHTTATQSATVTAGRVSTVNFTLASSSGTNSRAGTSSKPKRR